MEQKEITNHAELVLRIMQIRTDKFQQEEDLKKDIRRFVYELNPVSRIKASIHDLATDNKVKFDVAKIGMNLVANLLIDQVLGRHRSIKGFFRSVVVEKLYTIFDSKNTGAITNGINLFLNRNDKDQPNNQRQIADKEDKVL